MSGILMRREEPDLSEVRARVADRIRANFVELIPEPVWRDMVQAELDWFVKSPGAHWGGELKTPSPLQVLIRERLRELLGQRLLNELDGPEYQDVWDGAARKPGPMVKELVRTLMPELMEVAFGDMLQRALQTLRGQGKF